MTYSSITVPRVALVAIACLAASCANRPDSIRASYVSHEKFTHLGCDELGTRMLQSRAELDRNSAIQNEKADGDAVGVFLFGVPFSKLSGDVEGEIARLKGEIEAIETARIKNRCPPHRGMTVAAAASASATVGPPKATRASTPIAAGAASSAAVGLPAAGTQWIYGFSDRQYRKQLGYVTVRVLRVDGTVVEEAVSGGAKDGQRAVDTRDNRFYKHPVGDETLLIEFAPYLLAAHAGKAPAKMGEASGYPIGGPGLAGWAVKTSVRGWESITVPAGTFRALRIDVAGDREKETLTNHFHVGRFHISIWYVPEVMRAVRVEHRTYGGSLVRRGQQIGDEALELVSYERGR